MEKRILLKEYFPQGDGGQGMPLRKKYSSVFRFNLSKNTNIDSQGMLYLWDSMLSRKSGNSIQN